MLVAVAQVYWFVILARIISSWIGVDRSNQLVDFLHQITEPVLGPIRRALPPTGGFDFSPLLLLIGLRLIINGLQRYVTDF